MPSENKNSYTSTEKKIPRVQYEKKYEAIYSIGNTLKFMQRKYIVAGWGKKLKSGFASIVDGLKGRRDVFDRAVRGDEAFKSFLTIVKSNFKSVATELGSS